MTSTMTGTSTTELPDLPLDYRWVVDKTIFGTIYITLQRQKRQGWRRVGSYPVKVYGWDSSRNPTSTELPTRIKQVAEGILARHEEKIKQKDAVKGVLGIYEPVKRT